MTGMGRRDVPIGGTQHGVVAADAGACAQGRHRPGPANRVTPFARTGSMALSPESAVTRPLSHRTNANPNGLSPTVTVASQLGTGFDAVIEQIETLSDVAPEWVTNS